jgi:hypothetical protein
MKQSTKESKRKLREIGNKPAINLNIRNMAKCIGRWRKFQDHDLHN